MTPQHASDCLHHFICPAAMHSPEGNPGDIGVLLGRHAPGTLKASVMGLVDDEVTFVMTDIEGSTSLWEWWVSSTFSAIQLLIGTFPSD